MTSRNRIKMLILAAILILGLIGCTVRVTLGPNVWNLNIGPQATIQLTYTPNPTYTPRPVYTPMPSYTPRPTYTYLATLTTYLATQTGVTGTTPVLGVGEISQFATTSAASSQYASPDWGAMQAEGAPNTSTCGDLKTAWASASSHGKDWLLLAYEIQVIPSRIVIYQTFHPGAVSLVEVIDEAGSATAVYTAAPAVVSQCPYNLEIEVKNVNMPVRSVRVTIDQSNHDGWNEIDAVQLIGTPKQ